MPLTAFSPPLIIYHMAATDDNRSEIHQFCPTGEESWCKYQKAVSLVHTSPIHPRALSKSCMERVLGILELGTTGIPGKSRSRPKSAYFVPVPIQPGPS